MSYNILGINTSHNGSVCVLSDGKVVYYLEEDRLSRIKFDHLPIDNFEIISQKYNIDHIVIGGIDVQLYKKYFKLYYYLLKKYFPNSTIENTLKFHHLTHAYHTFYNSGFKKALGIVIDGSGSYLSKHIVETESISVLKYPSKHKPLYKSYKTNKSSFNKSNSFEIIDQKLTLSKTYEAVTRGLGFKMFEEGKTMGLSSYGNKNKNIPKLLTKGRGKTSNFSNFFNTAGSDGNLTKKFNLILKDNKLRQDLAYTIQTETQEFVGDLIEKYIKKSKLKKVVCSGGYFLNCVTNYYLIKRFPNIEFYFEPIAHDGGVAIGSAKWVWYEKTKDTKIRPQKTLYYGPKYSKKEILRKIDKYLE